MDQNTVIGFLDETSPQTTANTQRLWSYGKPTICKNTAKIRANTFGFYALNGNSVIDFEPNSKKESVCDFLMTVWEANIGKNIIMILDNFQSHKAKVVRQFAENHGIYLIYLPPYNPALFAPEIPGFLRRTRDTAIATIDAVALIDQLVNRFAN
jgi:hypothetical protein